MAIYSDLSDLRQEPGFPFDESWSAGDRPMLPGLYKCRCGLELPLPAGQALPGAEHRHQPAQGRAAWRLCVAAEEPTVVAIPAVRAHPKPSRRPTHAEGRLI